MRLCRLNRAWTLALLVWYTTHVCLDIGINADLIFIVFLLQLLLTYRVRTLTGCCIAKRDEAPHYEADTVPTSTAESTRPASLMRDRLMTSWQVTIAPLRTTVEMWQDSCDVIFSSFLFVLPTAVKIPNFCNVKIH